MTMSEFISQNMETILTDWEHFAATLHPAAEHLSPDELRDFGSEVLQTVAADMETRKSSVEQGEEARTEDQGHTPEVTESARKHAADRLHEGFTLTQLVEEYRALRANVTRRWAAQLKDGDLDFLRDLARFNEAIDQSMIDAIAWYSDTLDEARHLFTGVLAHDLRNPLGAIITLSEALLAADDLESQHTKAASRIRNSGNRMASMIADLLDFTRTRLGTGLPISPAPTDLVQHCHTVVDELQAFHPDVVFDLHLTGDLRGNWDRQRLEQLLSNLLGNAVTFASPGTPITLSATPEDEAVRVAVHNEGLPIPMEEQRSIFDPLARVASGNRLNGKQPDGLGLGLYIADQIAIAHGGSINVTSSAEAGTTFTVMLPRNHQDATEHSPPV